ncbi:MAG: hypothetical protein DRP82_05600 [Planctomycetota bacterium]|nr:MAG: hypothetical protein DRP82_05600 [Planctomycetota bacterium]
MKLKELLAIVEEIKKDLSYTKSLQERWEKERRRFPILYEYIGKQLDFFREKMEKVLEAEVKEESLDEYIRWRLQQVRKRFESGEERIARVANSKQDASDKASDVDEPFELRIQIADEAKKRNAK